VTAPDIGADTGALVRAPAVAADAAGRWRSQSS
jgi:hypothetical protein